MLSVTRSTLSLRSPPASGTRFVAKTRLSVTHKHARISTKRQVVRMGMACVVGGDFLMEGEVEPSKVRSRFALARSILRRIHFLGL